MLVELSIKNFAIIDELSIQFEKGLTVLSGETGAGKSIIIDAIGLLVGGRGSTEFVRYGTDRAEIEGLFSVSQEHLSIKKAEELGIEIEDEMLVLRRDITAQGKSICRLNGKLVTLSILREIGQTLVDIHGQHEHQVLLQSEQHLSLLDSYASKELFQVKKEYRNLYKKYQDISKELEQVSKNEQELAHRVDLIQYQLNEIDKANLTPNEDKELELEKYKLANSEKLYKSLYDSYTSLYGEGKGLDWLTKAMSYLEDAVEIDKNLSKLYENVSNSYYLLEEASFTLRNESESIEFDPIRLEWIDSRLNEINQLKRKYGPTVEDILQYAKNVSEELSSIENKEERILRLEQERNNTKEAMFIQAKRLHEIRKATANNLTKSIHNQLKALYMDKTVFEVQMVDKTDLDQITFSKNGMDEVEFYLSTNPGEPLKPLSKVASGGEISRIMLALKSIFTNHQGITSLIFDEVDTGVSGRVAQAIGEKIYHIAVDSQVLCITHLPQVAAIADQHLFISKEQMDDRTKTKVITLSENQKVEEIGRMISGAEMTALTKQHAEELLVLAKKLKSNT